MALESLVHVTTVVLRGKLLCGCRLPACVCACMRAWVHLCVCVCRIIYVEIRGQPKGINFLLPYASWELNLGHQAWNQVLFTQGAIVMAHPVILYCWGRHSQLRAVAGFPGFYPLDVSRPTSPETAIQNISRYCHMNKIASRWNSLHSLAWANLLL